MIYPVPYPGEGQAPRKWEAEAKLCPSMALPSSSLRALLPTNVICFRLGSGPSFFRSLDSHIPAYLLKKGWFLPIKVLAFTMILLSFPCLTVELKSRTLLPVLYFPTVVMEPSWIRRPLNRSGQEVQGTKEELQSPLCPRAVAVAPALTPPR